MIEPFKEAVSLCKTIMRNGYDAYVINARLQKDVLRMQKVSGGELCMDISTELDLGGLRRLFLRRFAKVQLAVLGFGRRLPYHGAAADGTGDEILDGGLGGGGGGIGDGRRDRLEIRLGFRRGG